MLKSHPIYLSVTNTDMSRMSSYENDGSCLANRVFFSMIFCQPGVSRRFVKIKIFPPPMFGVEPQTSCIWGQHYTTRSTLHERVKCIKVCVQQSTSSHLSAAICDWNSSVSPAFWPRGCGLQSASRSGSDVGQVALVASPSPYHDVKFGTTNTHLQAHHLVWSPQGDKFHQG